MRVSDLAQLLADDHFLTIRIETRSDAIAIISNDFQLRSYIKEFGDVVVEFHGTCNVYTVPEFAAVIARYSAAKQIECDRWGCE